ncbi:endonuclease III [Geomicrobium sp. JCM 19055]|nr:endonuclease III [Geomicrobium sp. JCM 19055]
MSESLLVHYGGEVPQDRDELMKLAGVGRKTANVVASVAFDLPAIAVDTHVERVSKRLGICRWKDSVLEVEKTLMVKLPEDRWSQAHHQLIFFGRYFCKARNPQCESCPLLDICREGKKTRAGGTTMMTAELHKLDELKQSLPFGEQESWRLQQLENKLKGEDVFSVAICGHFSAGKSTLINQLLGANLLPSSPVPTTANIMTIQGGEETAIRAIKNNGQEEQFQGHIPWEKLQQLALDGDGVKEIVLTLPLPFLKRKVTLADTPGMDSTDPTHGRYTANQLLTTDAIIYVTDYNHVRSQTNLQFLKQLQRENKPFVIVVNQIDKHNDDELSFSIFKHGLLDMLQRYGIKPVKVFTTSARAKKTTRTTS